MCGIVGVLSRAPVDPAIVEKMRDELIHRGPDHAGRWRSPDGKVCLGHRRLAIIDLDERANQPMVSHDGRFVVSFNGEIYNFRKMRKSLEAAGVRFRTESDTEVLIEAYRSRGASALDELSGMFAFAIWDAAERRLFCARDRAGEKPFYYALCDGEFAFASELKGLLAWPAMRRRVDHESLIDFLTLGYVADPKSIWKDARKLAPAHSMTVEFDAGGSAVASAPVRYWSLPFGARAAPVSGERIRAALLDAADEMAIADVPLGSFLSGGVDSSSVTAALSLSGHAVRSFTIGFDDPAYDERHWARQVAERYRTTHVERTVVPADMVSVLDRLNWHFDEPFSDYSSVPTFCLCREARPSITVALSGDGADEVFAGYRKYQRLARRAELAGVFPVGMASAIAALANRTLPEGNHWRRTLGQYGLAAPKMLADMLCVGFPLPLLRQVARGPLAEALRHYSSDLLVEQVLAEAPVADMGLVDAMRHLDFALTLPGDMLVKVDRASMAVSLEVRPLFLNRALMELAAAIPGSELASRNSAKTALKDAVRPWLPDALIDRRKQGFALPLPQWIGEESAISAALFEGEPSEALAEILDLPRLSRIARDHVRGAGNFTGMLYASFTLDQWFKKWLPR
ncbi:MAG: asparagine synthase (glutamine-hydrolyzing) [Caldimonas sp.]